MKTFFRLIILGVLLYFGYNYVKENKPSVAAEIQPVLQKIQEVSGELMDELQHESSALVKQEKDYAEEDQDHKGKTTVQHTSELQHAPGSKNQQKEKPSHKARDRSQEVEERNYNTTSNEKAGADWIKDITKNYSPGSWELLQYYEELPRKVSAQSENDYVINSSKSVDTYHYVKYHSKVACINSMATNVHEIAHAYHSLKAYDYASQNNKMLKWENTSGYIYLSPTEGYPVSFPRKLLFPSRELAGRIPASRETFRYDTYITGTNFTQDDGVFGLLDEFHAYYLDSRFCYDMYEVYKKIYPRPGNGLIKWITHTQSTMAAFYEFHFFIQEYLLYMKEKHPENFEQLMQYAPFRQAYGAIYERYHQLVNDYRNLIVSKKERLNKEGKAEAVVEGNVLWIQYPGSSSKEGVKIIIDDVKKLQTVLESNRYEPIQKEVKLSFR